MKSLALRIILPSALSVFALPGSNAYRGDSTTDDAFMLPYPTDTETALEALRLGNQRFTTSHRTLSTNTRHDAHFRHATARDQHPFVAMLACSDRRACPEFIFDQSFGSIFEIRNAGNVVDDDVLASLEYAVDHLHIPLVVVLGHKGCGAIDAVCAAGEEPLHDHLRVLQEKMQGIRAEVLAGNHRHDPATVNRLSRENAKQQVITLLYECPLIRAAIERGECQVVHALYDMETGLVEFSDEVSQ